MTKEWYVVAGIRRAEFRNDTEFIADFSSTSNSAKFTKTTWQLGTTYALGHGVSLFRGYNTGYDVERTLQARRPDGTPFRPESYEQFEAGMRLSRGAVTLPGYLTVDLGASTRFGPWRLDAALTSVFDKT